MPKLDPEEFCKCLDIALSRPALVDKLSKAIMGPYMEDLANLKLAGAERDKQIKTLETEVEGLKPLSQEVHDLRELVKAKNSSIDTLKKEVERLDSVDETLEQYTRRNSLRISGIPERPEEDTTELILTVCNEVLKVEPALKVEDIDRLHRVGSQSPTSTRPILVKFATYRTREKVFRVRSTLRPGHRDPRRPWTSQPDQAIQSTVRLNNVDVDTSRLYINEDLTKTRDNLMYQARKAKKDKRIIDCWSFDGLVRIKDNNNAVFKIKNAQELLAHLRPA